jgi:hypothetical protein
VPTLESEARRRAVDGVDEPVFHKGRICGTVRKYSDALLMFLLRGNAPEKYKEGVTVGGNGAQIIINMESLPDNPTDRRNLIDAEVIDNEPAATNLLEAPAQAEAVHAIDPS